VSAFPTNDDLVCVSVQWPAAEAPAFRADLEANFLQTVRLAPGLADRLAAGDRARPFVTTTDLPNFLRTSAGPGWALVGDAGRHQDPFLAQGIANAFRDAELLAEAIDAGLSGQRPLDDALAGYEQHRACSGLPSYEFTTRLAGLEPPGAEMIAVLRSVRSNPERTERFLGLLAGSVAVSEFFDLFAPVGGIPCRP
jgi:2-polyprenyl-6-methoxyphenol hydroxylase-like FAD-dependent oxidoreductase